ncbi:MAG TPA: hypothetical protein VEH62_11310 [Gemmatimonadales bacterium]|nr:hypothetical protein [Gemmatimonadales bacterium]
MTNARARMPQLVTETLQACHRAAGPRYIVGAGCELPRDTSEAHVRAMCACARDTTP